GQRRPASDVQFGMFACLPEGSAVASRLSSEPVEVPAGDVRLAGDLALPAEPRGAVVFAHGSGSGRHSPRNRLVAAVFQYAGFAPLLIDLLPADEANVDARTSRLRFDIDLLSGRLVHAVDWLRQGPATLDLAVGLFGASTGAAAALNAAAARPGAVAA